MKIFELQSKLIVACLALISVVTFLKASYYEPNFFPIGLTGLNGTGSGQQNNCPYSNVIIGGQRMWYWDTNPNFPTQTEKTLIEALGVNCIGSEDMYPGYVVDLNPTQGPASENNYLHKVCMESDSAIYLIPTGLWLDRIRVHGCLRDSCGDTVFPWEKKWDTIPGTHAIWVSTGSPGSVRASTLFRDWIGEHQYQGYGPDEFRDCAYGWDGDSAWDTMVDRAMDSLKQHFDRNGSHSDYIWGWNFMTEDPTVARNSNSSPPSKGVWGAVDRVITGHRAFYDSRFSNLGAAPHYGFLGVEDSCAGFGNERRMMVVKGHVWMYANPQPSVNMFEYLPYIDVLVEYNHYWNRAIDDYGDQHFLDRLLYGSSHADSTTSWEHPEGYHNTAVYMQRYGGTGGGPAGQKRRWMPGLCIESRVDTLIDTFALCRRPCPPEIRAATYLCLSRGAKGILFHPWLNDYTGNHYKPPSNLHIPSDSLSSTRIYYNVGLRDCYGYPFGDDNSDTSNTHKLNNGNGDTYWHDYNADTTYAYLKTLIQEIKLITPTLIQLDWVNGYSLNSTDPEWAFPCPHDYVMDVSGVSYMDLGLFDHPYEPVGVEYFMLVNREGIADMTNRTVTVALDAGHWPGADSLSLTDIADKKHPQTLKRDGDRFVFTQVFEPGEGKLYRVAPITELPITMLHR